MQARQLPAEIYQTGYVYMLVDANSDEALGPRSLACGVMAIVAMTQVAVDYEQPSDGLLPKMHVVVFLSQCTAEWGLDLSGR